MSTITPLVLVTGIVLCSWGSDINARRVGASSYSKYNHIDHEHQLRLICTVVVNFTAILRDTSQPDMWQKYMGLSVHARISSYVSTCSPSHGGEKNQPYKNFCASVHVKTIFDKCDPVGEALVRCPKVVRVDASDNHHATQMVAWAGRPVSFEWSW
jgi:hypothetical protein